MIDTLANYGASDDIIDSALDVIFALPPANPFWRMRTLGASRASFDYKALAPQRIDIAYDPDEVVYECVESDEVLSRMEQTAFIEGIPSIEVMRVGALPQDGESVLESAVATCLEDIYDIEGVTFRVCKSTAPPRQLRRRIERGKVSDRLLPEIAGSMGIDHAASIEALASSPHAVNCRVAQEIMELYSDKSSAFEQKLITLKKELDDEAGALLQKLSSPPSGDAGSAASWKNSQHDIFYRLILGPFYASNGDMSRDEVEMLTFADVVEKLCAIHVLVKSQDGGEPQLVPAFNRDAVEWAAMPSAECDLGDLAADAGQGYNEKVALKKIHSLHRKYAPVGSQIDVRKFPTRSSNPYAALSSPRHSTLTAAQNEFEKRASIALWSSFWRRWEDLQTELPAYANFEK